MTMKLILLLWALAAVALFPFFIAMFWRSNRVSQNTGGAPGLRHQGLPGARTDREADRGMSSSASQGSDALWRRAPGGVMARSVRFFSRRSNRRGPLLRRYLAVNGAVRRI